MDTAPPDDDTRPSPDHKDPGEAAQVLRARLEERDREVDELRAEVEQLREQRRQAGRLALAGGSFASWFAARVFIGWDLTGTMRTWFDALRHWLEAKAPADSIPVEETANLAAAIVRRWLRVGLWHVVLASGGAVTAGILIWQGFLIRGQIQQQQAQNELVSRQIEQQQAQNDLLRTQNEQQQADTLIVRRAQLLDTIYTGDCTDPEDPKTCKPKANPRSVREAVLAFVEIERGHPEKPDLSRANLNGAELFAANLSRTRLSEAFLSKTDLREADLSGAELSRANLQRANLEGANLSGADLFGAELNEARLFDANLNHARLTGTILHEANLFRANLRGANLLGANLIGANLRNAELTGADLYNAFLQEADLSGTNLLEADLREAQNLTSEQLATACGDGTTKLPNGLDMPDTWPCRWERDASGEWVRVPPNK